MTEVGAELTLSGREIPVVVQGIKGNPDHVVCIFLWEGSFAALKSIHPMIISPNLTPAHLSVNICVAAADKQNGEKYEADFLRRNHL